MTGNLPVRLTIPALTAAACLLAGCASTAGPAGPDASAARLEPAARAYLDTIDALMPGMGAASIMDRKDSQLAFERICFKAGAPGNEELRAALCRAIIRRTGTDQPKPARVWLLRKVETLGRDEVVPALVALCYDPDAEIRDLARRALQNNPSPAAAAELRRELGKARDPAWQAALIGALGARRDAASVPLLARLAGESDPQVAGAAIWALGKVADDPATKVLEILLETGPAGLRGEIVDAWLRTARAVLDRGDRDRAAQMFARLDNDNEPETVRLAAIEGLAAAQGINALPRLLKLVDGPCPRMQVAAAGCLRRMQGSQATTQLMTAVDTLGPAGRAVVVEVLGDRGDRAAARTVCEQLSGDGPVRLAALEALEHLGDGSHVDLLADWAAKGDDPEKTAARQSLAGMSAADVDEAVLTALARAEGPVRQELIRAAGARRIRKAMPQLLEAAASPDDAFAAQVIQAVGYMSQPQDLGTLIDLLARLQSPGALKAAEDAIRGLCLRIGDQAVVVPRLAEAMQRVAPPAQASILRILETFRNDEVLALVRRSLSSEHQVVAGAAGAVLANWPPLHVAKWSFAGPYRQEGKGPQELFDAVFDPEKPDANVQWQALGKARPDGDGHVRLERLGAGDNCCGYLRTTVVSEREQEVVLVAGSDDGLKVWLNGEVIHSKNAVRGVKCGQDQVPCRLRQGENTLLVKVTQGGADWALCCGFRMPDGGPAAGLVFKAQD